MDSDSAELETAAAADGPSAVSDEQSIDRAVGDEDGDGGDNIRRFTETVQLRSALGEVPRKPPVVPNNVSNLLPLAAALALVIIGGLITVLATDGGSGEQTAGATLLSEGAADDIDVTATAAVLQGDDRQTLRLNFDRDLHTALVEDDLLTSGSEYLALWLTNPGRTEVLPLGVIYDDAVIPLPSGVDITSFSVLDISVELVDGDPAHSGRTVMRGVLEPS